ncbi:MAG: hypothetical protein QM723_33495 [Myxococcaceae bacterium]
MRWLVFIGALCCCSCGTQHCPPGLSRCDGECVDATTSLVHCGACYNACGAGQACVSGVCRSPACANGIVDGTETAADCGGNDCPACAAGRHCLAGSDCQSGHCKPATMSCSEGECDDGIKDGQETDVDCGGSCPLKCGSGGKCISNSDCAQGTCFGDGVCRVEGLTLSADRTVFFVGRRDVAHLTASYIADGVGVASVPVELQADFGTGSFVDADGGSLGQTVTPVTDASGAAQAGFIPEGDAGTTTVVARVNGDYATLTFTRLGTNAPAWQSTRCGGVDCTELAPRGTGNDTAVVTFLVTDGAGTPIAGAPIAFATPVAPAGVTFDPAGVTDGSGLVSTTVHTGTSVSAIWVSATAPSGHIGYSPYLTMAARRPTNDRTFAIYCNDDTLPAFESLSPPLVTTTACTMRLSDRYGNAIASSTEINLIAEAGSVPAQVSSTGGFGTVNFTFSTSGGWPPADVSPFPALANNGPLAARDAEPVTDAGGNPRDGLVTVMAYTTGDEYLHDLNQNGVWDPGEWFIDQGEPLLDANDDGVWTPGETFIDANSNGVWDGPNGAWDTGVLIWSDTTFLYTGLPAFLFTTPSDFGVCPGGVPKGGTQTLTAHVFDSRLNFPQGSPSAVTVAHSASKGYVTKQLGLSPFDTNNSSVGFVFADGGTCDAGSDPCYRQRFFDKWPDGYSGTITVHGTDVIDMSACESDVITTTVTVENVATQFTISGAIQ